MPAKKEMIKQKESIGVTIFGIIFILIGLYILFFSIENLYFYLPENKVLAYTYNITSLKIDDLENYVNENIKDKNLISKFNQEKIKLKNYIQTSKVNLPIILITSLFLTISIITFLLYLISGFAILRLHRRTYRLIFWSIFFGFILFVLFVANTYITLKQIISLTKKTLDLSNLVSNELQDVKIEQPFKLMFANQKSYILFISFVLYVIFSIFSSIFFCRKKIKSQFA